MAKTIDRLLLALFCALPAATTAQMEMRAPEASMVMAQADAQGVGEPAASDQPTGGENAAAAVFDQDSDPDGSRAAEIVRRADEIRFPQQAFQVDVTVSSTSGGQELEPRLYRILSKGNENTIVQTLEPATERGQNMLMRGRELWVYMPSVSQPVRLSLSQRLTGQVANGDLARANFSGDYTAKQLRTEKIDEHEYHVLELVAAARGVTYPRVVYWVRVDNNHPYKSEFYALSGRLLKTCTYEEFAELGNAIRPTRLVMTDAVKVGDRSVLEYSELIPRDLPNRMFTKDYMKRLD